MTIESWSESIFFTSFLFFQLRTVCYSQHDCGKILHDGNVGSFLRLIKHPRYDCQLNHLYWEKRILKSFCMGARFSRWRESARSRRRARHGSNSAVSPSVNSRSKGRTSVSADSPSVISGQSTSRRSTSWFAKRKKKKDDKQEESQRVRNPSSAQLRKVTEVSAEVEEPTPVPSHFSQEVG